MCSALQAASPLPLAGSLAAPLAIPDPFAAPQSCWGWSRGGAEAEERKIYLYRLGRGRNSVTQPWTVQTKGDYTSYAHICLDEGVRSMEKAPRATQEAALQLGQNKMACILS